MLAVIFLIWSFCNEQNNCASSNFSNLFFSIVSFAYEEVETAIESIQIERVDLEKQIEDNLATNNPGEALQTVQQKKFQVQVLTSEVEGAAQHVEQQLSTENEALAGSEARGEIGQGGAKEDSSYGGDGNQSGSSIESSIMGGAEKGARAVERAEGGEGRSRRR